VTAGLGLPVCALRGTRGCAGSIMMGPRPVGGASKVPGSFHVRVQIPAKSGMFAALAGASDQTSAPAQIHRRARLQNLLILIALERVFALYHPNDRQSDDQ
jgi:hypothetical protein